MDSKHRTPQAAFVDIPGELPKTSNPENVDLASIAQTAVIRLNSLQSEHLAANAIWRDLLALTDYYRTFYSSETVFATLQKLSRQKKRSLFRLKPGRDPRIGRSAKGSSWVDIDILFSAQHGNLARNCMGTVSLCYESGDQWRIWMLRTWLECFDGHGHPDVPKQLDSPDNSSKAGLTNAVNGAIHEPSEYGAVVVGGGQAGLAVGGRLEALGVSYVVIENHAEVGDTWTERYDSLRWHTSRDYGVLPFGRTFLDSDPKLMPAKRIGAGHKRWVETYGINVQTNTTVNAAKWDHIARRWIVEMSGPQGKTTVRTRNLVLAIGAGHGMPIYPPWATTQAVKSSGYKGTVMHSFVGYRSSHQWANQRGVVIGTANTAHDVAEDMANAGMETLMVQRSPTFVFPGEWLIHAEDMNYHADQPAAVADRETFTYPNPILRAIINEAVHKGIGANPARFDALEKAGFKLDRFGDIYENLYVRFGGHYVDIGGSARIANGEIKVKTQAVERLTENGLLFEDGEEVAADVIVLCTGFEHDFRTDAARIIGQDIADQVDDFFGMNKEGEIRGHARPAGHPNLYYQGGDVRIARFYSQFIALQIQAEVLGHPMKPYMG